MFTFCYSLLLVFRLKRKKSFIAFRDKMVADRGPCLVGKFVNIWLFYIEIISRKTEKTGEIWVFRPEIKAFHIKDQFLVILHSNILGFCSV